MFHPTMQQQVWNILTTVYKFAHFKSDIFISKPRYETRVVQLTVHLVAVVTAPWWRGSVGWEGSVGRRWILCSCCALLSKEMSCADPSNAGEDELCTPMAGSWVLSWQKDSDWEKGNAGNLPPNCLTPGTREVESLQTSHQPSLQCI